MSKPKNKVELPIELQNLKIEALKLSLEADKEKANEAINDFNAELVKAGFALAANRLSNV